MTTAQAEQTLAGLSRDPDHEVRAEPAAGRVRVRIDGEQVAASGRALAVEESNHPRRYYLPPESVAAGALRAIDHHTVCPYKGIATYWVPAGSSGDPTEAVAWSYPDPLPMAAELAGYLSFEGPGVEVEVG